MASTAVLRALRRREFAAPLRHLSGKLTSPPGQKWASLVRPFSSKPAGSDVIGVDLGTTNSGVSAMEGKTAKVIENSEGAQTAPTETTSTEWKRQLLKRMSELDARLINLNDELTAATLKHTQTFSTASDNDVKVFQGERELARDNKVFQGLPFVQGIVEKMLRGDDAESAELFFAKNSADSIIYIIEKGLSEDKDQIPAEVASEIESAVANVRIAIARDDVGRIEQTLDAAKTAVSKAPRIVPKLKSAALIFVKNYFDSFIHTVKKSLSEAKDKIPAEVASEIESGMAYLRTAATALANAGDDVGKIKEILQAGEHM